MNLSTFPKKGVGNCILSPKVMCFVCTDLLMQGHTYIVCAAGSAVQ